MGKFFPKLTQTHVFIQTEEDGTGFNCKMLPVSALDEMQSCCEDLRKASGADAETAMKEVERAKNRLIALASMVIPDSYKDNLKRFDIPALTELVAYLMYGDGNDTPKKN